MVIWRLHIIWKCAVGWRVSTWLLHKSWLSVLALSTALLSPTIGLLLILSFPCPHSHLLIHGALGAQYVGDHFLSSGIFQMPGGVFLGFRGREFSKSFRGMECLDQLTLSAIRENIIPSPHPPICP